MRKLVRTIGIVLRFTGTVLGWFSTKLLLTLVFIILGIAGTFFRVFRKDPLDRELGDRNSYWRAKEETPHTLREAGQQF